VNMKQHSNQQPVVGSIYHDKSDRSFTVLKILGDKILLEYASGTVTSIDAKNWQQLQPQVAVY
jgi:hypothetical protein